MQNKGNHKKPVQEIKKPIIPGSWHGKHALQLALKRFLGMFAIILIYLVGGIMLTVDSLWGRVFTCVMLVLATGYYQYVAGVGQGQTDAAFGEILYNRRESGHDVPSSDIDRSFHPAKGFFAVLLGALPFVLFTLVFALMTEKTSYSLGGLPGWAASLTGQSEFADALRYYETRNVITAMDTLRVIDRAMVMPFINVAVNFGSDAALLVERLSPLLVLIAPMGYGIGYAEGLKARTRINTGIKMGDDKKKRKERKARRQRQRSTKAPERLV